MGILVSTNSIRGVIGHPFMTAYLNSQFKAPVRSNATYLAVATLDKVEGRKVLAKCSVQDGEGKVLLTADGLFLQLQTKL